MTVVFKILSNYHDMRSEPDPVSSSLLKTVCWCSFS